MSSKADDADTTRGASAQLPAHSARHLLTKHLLMIKVKLYQNKNKNNKTAYGLWYPRVVAEETIGLEELSEHMANHNTPFSKGTINGILTDAVGCIRELLLLGKNVKLPDLAIFSVGIRVKGGAKTKEEFSVTKNINSLKLRSRGTGELTSASLKLDATIKCIDKTAEEKKDEGTEVPGNE